MSLVFVLAAALLALLLQWLSARQGLGGLQGACRLSARMAEADERFSIVVTLTNPSRRFFPFLRFQIRTSEGMAVHQKSGVTPLPLGGLTVAGTTWLGPRQRFEKRIPASIAARGRYLVQGFTVSGGDFLGLSEYSAAFGWGGEIVVPPREAPQAEVDALFGGFLGDISVSRFLFEDPVLTLGYRAYTGREPMKAISWTQSARTGSLMLAVYAVVGIAAALMWLFSWIKLGFQPPEETVMMDLQGMAETLGVQEASDTPDYLTRIAAALGIIGGILLLWAVFRFLSRRNAAAPPPEGGSQRRQSIAAAPAAGGDRRENSCAQQVRAQYRRFLKLYRRAGFPRSPRDTSRDIVRYSREAMGDDVSALRELYIAARYDGAATREDAAQAREICARLKRRQQK